MLKWALDESAIVAFTDLRGVITHVNKKFCEISGFDRGELIGKTHAVVNSGCHPREFFTEMWRALRDGEIWRGEICNRKKDGGIYWVDTTIVPLISETPTQSRFVAIRNEITERKLAEEELAKQQERTTYAEKMASLGELTAGICHEIGNPVSTLRGRAELTRMKLESVENLVDARRAGNELAQIVIRLADRMSGIMRSMSSLARDGSADSFLRVPLDVLLENTIEFGAEKYRKNFIKMSFENQCPDGMLIECRETQVIQIIVNLINNACDAVKHLKEKWIRVEASQEDQFVEMRVIDSGLGLPEDLVEKVFESYFTTKAAGQGTGIGLSISRQLAEANNGTLTVDSGETHTTFVLRLPLRQPVRRTESD